MKSFAIAAFAAVAVAFPQYEVAPAYNTTSVEKPAYSTPAVPSYVASSSSAKYSYAATTVECSGPTEVPVGPSYTFTYTGTETTTLTFSYPVSAPAGEYTPAPVAPSYPTSNGTAPSVPAGTAPAATGTGSYTVPSPSAPATEFPGAAGKTGLSMLAVAGALAAFL